MEMNESSVPAERAVQSGVVVWRKLRLGTTHEEYLRKYLPGVYSAPFGLKGNAMYTPFEVVKANIDLVVIDGVRLGMLEEATIDEVIDYAGRLGLKVCPVETGYALRLDYDQPQKERLVVPTTERNRVQEVAHTGVTITTLTREEALRQDVCWEESLCDEIIKQGLIYRRHSKFVFRK